MTDYQLDTRPFFQILHNLIRHDDFDYDPERTEGSVKWMHKHAIALRTVTSSAEFGIVRVFYAYWDKHKVAPDRKVLGELVHSQQKCEPMLQVLVEYDRHAEDLDVISPLSLDLYMDQRIEDYEKHKLTNILTVAASITIGPRQMNDKEKTTLCGPRDALKYMHERLQQGVLFDGTQGSTGGVLAETASHVMDNYRVIEHELINRNLCIPTGLPLIDQQLGGLRRKELNGLLGFTGQRKTMVARSIAYNAADAGFRVLHIPMESDYDEEQNAYVAMHAGRCLVEEHGISKTALELGRLSRRDKELMPSVIDSYRQHVAQNITVISPSSRTWGDVRDLISHENDKQPVDLVIIDYLTMLATPGNRDDIADKMAIIQDAKRLAMTANNGRGLCILTPVQGNRKGYQDAAENDGMWCTSGIAKYSELDKSLDNCFYTFFNDEMNSQNQMKIGSCKTRRSHNIPSTLVNVDPKGGLIRSADLAIPAAWTPPQVISSSLSMLIGIEEAEYA